MGLVRAIVGDSETNVTPEFAESNGLTVLDEPTHRPDGRPRPETRRGGRPLKPRTSVNAEAAKKAPRNTPDPISKEK